MQCLTVTKRASRQAVYSDPENKNKVTGYENRYLYDTVLTAVYSDECPENKVFWEATPSGSLNVATAKISPWEPGKFYYIDVTEVVEN